MLDLTELSLATASDDAVRVPIKQTAKKLLHEKNDMVRNFNGNFTGFESLLDFVQKSPWATTEHFIQ